jgi:Secretion system C-terminal sorting domain/Family of unknown function (DUF3836)
MKNFFTLMAVLLLSLTARAQHSNLKSSEALKFRMDSLESNYWDSYQEMWDTSMNYYDYNAYGQMTLYHNTWLDNSTGELLREGRYEYSYNEDGSMAEALVLEWDEDTDDWENDDLDVYTYDEDGNQTGSVGYRWDDANELWIRKDSSFNVYNDEGLLSEHSGYEWKTDRWVIRYFTSDTYEEHGWLDEHLSRMWYEDDQEWKNNSKWVYAWNEQGQSLGYVRYDQDVYDGPWLEESKVDKIYNDENLLYITNSGQWETDHWQINRIDTMDYNSSGWLIEVRGYYLDEGNMRQNNNYSYSYDASGNVKEYIYSYWDKNASKLVVYGKDLFTYDLSYAMTDIVLPDESSEWYGYLLLNQFSNIPMSIHVLHWKNETWVDYLKKTFFYSEKNVEGLGLEEQEREMVRVYPNPVSDHLYMDLPEGSSHATLSLYELTGRQVLRRKVDAGASLSLTALPAGIYLYRMSVDGKIQSGKLVKR